MRFEDNILFHTFTTEAYMPWAELYLESLRRVYGDGVQVRMDTLNVSDESLQVLNQINSKLDLHNHREDHVHAACELGLDAQTFQHWKTDVETGNVTPDNYLYKIYISVNKRYRNLQQVLHEAQQAGFKYVIHSDVDIYFRHKLDGLLKILEANDFAAYFRSGAKSQEKVLGAFLGFNLSPQTDVFLSEWMQQIDAVPFHQRWRGFGQSVLWYASEKSQDLVRIADLSNHEKAPVYSQMFAQEADFWLGSNSISFNSQKTPLLLAWKDFKDSLPRMQANDLYSGSDTFFLKATNRILENIYMLARKLKRMLQRKW